MAHWKGSLIALAAMSVFAPLAIADPDPATDPGFAPADSLLVTEIVAAESTVDSLRAAIRKLDREIQSMKQDYADVGDIDLLLEALADPAELIESAPEDTRSRRHRVDTLLRAITQRPGQLRFNGGATLVAQELVAGETTSGAGAGSFDLFAHTSFGPSTLLFFAFEAGSGEGVDGLLPPGQALNADAAPTRSAEGYDLLVLNEAWAEFTAVGGAVILTAGKIDLTNYFDINRVANDETAQFLSTAFVNSAALAAPASGPGLRARTVLARRLSVQAGVVSADSTGGTRFADAFAIASVGALIPTGAEREGNLRTYAYIPPDTDGAVGWGLSLDQDLGGSWQAFARWGENDRKLWQAGAARRAWSGGLQWQRPWRQRNFYVAAAWGETREADGSLATTFEAYASMQLNTWTSVSPHVQRVRNETRFADPATAVGLRVQFNF